MRIISKHLTRWLNIWLIFTLLGSLLPPTPIASASSLGNSSAVGRPDSYPVNLSRFTSEDTLPAIREVTNVTGGITTHHNSVPHRSPSAPQTLSLPFDFNPATPTNHSSQIAQATSQSGLLFIENVGQFDAKARFMVRGGNGTLYLAEDALWFTILERTEPHSLTQKLKDAREGRLDPQSLHPTPKRGVNLKVSFPGANSHAQIESFDRLDTQVSYFIGKDQAKWQSDVPVWGGVRYVDFYPGVDLEIMGKQGQLELRLVLRQSAEQAVEAQRNRGEATFSMEVRLRVEEVDALALEGDALRLTTAVGDFKLPLLSVMTADGAPLTLY